MHAQGFWSGYLLLAAFATSPLLGKIYDLGVPLSVPRWNSLAAIHDEDTGSLLLARGEKKVPLSPLTHQALTTLAPDGRMSTRWDVYLPGVGYKAAMLHDVDAWLDDDGKQVLGLIGTFTVEIWVPAERAVRVFAFRRTLEERVATREHPKQAIIDHGYYVHRLQPERTLDEHFAAVAEKPPLLVSEDYLGVVSSDVGLSKETDSGFTPPAGVLPVTPLRRTLGGNILWVRTDALMRVLNHGGNPGFLDVYESPEAFFSRAAFDPKYSDILYRWEGSLESLDEAKRKQERVLRPRVGALSPRYFPVQYRIEGLTQDTALQKLHYLVRSAGELNAPSKVRPLPLRPFGLTCAALVLLGWIYGN